MPETEMIDARVEPGLKHEAEAVLAGMGLSVAEAITLFYKQVTLQRGIPLAMRVPNAEDARGVTSGTQERENLTEYDSLDHLRRPHTNERLTAHRRAAA